MVISLDADYVVYGGGAMGMAFADVLLTETKATIIIVDKYGQPGGHWNNAYPYVRLHQPSSAYGVNSRRLERSDDPLELASRNEVLAYFEGVLETFISSGRVQYFPMCYCEDTTARRFHSLVQPEKVYEVSDRAKIVDATYMKVEVPSVSDPRTSGRYEVDDGVDLVPLNDLTRITLARDRYVIIGAGKSGMDAVLWLLDNGVDAARIYWVMPRDSWVIDRAMFKPGAFDFFDSLEVLMKSDTLDDIFTGLEKTGMMARIDTTSSPTMYKCATVSQSELKKLRSIKNVVRLGRVSRLTREQAIFDNGVLSAEGSTLYVDCSADGLVPRPAVPIFQSGNLVLQPVALCQQVFSAAVIAHVEARGGSDEIKNSLCGVIPHPDRPEDFLFRNVTVMKNKAIWSADGEMSRWLNNSRLNGLEKLQHPGFLTLISLVFKNIRRLPLLRGAQERIEANTERILQRFNEQGSPASKL